MTVPRIRPAGERCFERSVCIAFLLLMLGAWPLSSPVRAESVELAVAAAALAAAYPDFIARAEGEAIVWRDGTVERLVPTRDLSPHEYLAAPSLSEQFLFSYSLAPWSADNLPTNDPGRARREPFFEKMYGDCRRGQPQRHLRGVAWLPGRSRHSLWVTRINGIDRRVEAVAHEVRMLPPALRAMVVHIGGGFACRRIFRTSRPSMHAYGAAVDLDPRLGRYWVWAGLSSRVRSDQRVPQEVVEIFEKHGFIWGGKWFHVDGMHFEYRPELIEYARRTSRPIELPPLSCERANEWARTCLLLD